MVLNWHTTKEDFELIDIIAERAMPLIDNPTPDTKRLMFMDLAATHLNGCPLDLEGLAKAEPLDFTHDVFGIRRYLDRNTGKLTEFFTPRWAKREQ